MVAVGIERVVLAAQEGGQFRQYSAAAVATTAIGLMSSTPANRAMLGDPQFHDPPSVPSYFSQAWDGSEERRVWKEWFSTYRSRWYTSHYKQKKGNQKIQQAN